MWPFTRRTTSSYSSRRKNERDLKLDYFAHVVADFHRLPKPVRTSLLADLPASLEALLRTMGASGQLDPSDEEHLDWGEIATLEDKTLALDDESGLRRRAWQIRSRYARLAGKERYQAYLSSGPPDEKDPLVTADALRADLRRLLAATHFTYSMAMVRENNRRRVLDTLLAWTLGLCAPFLVAFVWLTYFADARQGGLLAVVPLLGVLGAYISIQRRLQNTADGGDPVIGVLALHEFNSVLRFPLIAGGVFAVVLYLVLAGEFLTGSLFPEFEDGVPRNTVQWANLFIWAFIAGFAERLVPDTLDRLVQQAAQASEPVPIEAAARGGGTAASTATRAPDQAAAQARTVKLVTEFHTKAPTPPPVPPASHEDHTDGAL